MGSVKIVTTILRRRMNNFKSEDIIWEDYIEVAAEKYALYYEQDTDVHKVESL